MNFDKITRKKERLDGPRPLPEALARNLDDWFRIELTYTSNAIEGNTLTRRETALVVDKGLTVGGKSLVEHIEAINHARALDWVREQVEMEPRRGPDSLGGSEILHIHSMVLKGIDDDNAGRYRLIPVRIAGSTTVLPNPFKVPELMADLVHLFRNEDNLHPVELAAEAHYRLVSIHPFVDGNGRTARLLMNMILMMADYPPAIIRKRDRLAYIASLEKISADGDKGDYLEIIAGAVNRSLNIYLKAAAGEDAGQPEDEALLRTGQLARQTGERNSAIRHWTKQGLLEVAETTEAGYQLYAPEMIERIGRIHELKKQRLTLDEIRERLG